MFLPERRDLRRSAQMIPSIAAHRSTRARETYRRRYTTIHRELQIRAKSRGSSELVEHGLDEHRRIGYTLAQQKLIRGLACSPSLQGSQARFRTVMCI